MADLRNRLKNSIEGIKTRINAALKARYKSTKLNIRSKRR
jgi:hypothetical protein